MSSKQIYVSDFDGTLTTTDSMLRLIIFCRGKAGLAVAMLLQLPYLILMLLHLYPNQRTKERLLHYCFRNTTLSQFEALCQRFADSHRHILRTDLYQHLLEQQRAGHRVIVVTASAELWVQKFVPEFEVVGTQLLFDHHGLTPHFLTKNCWGHEKVRRLEQAVPDLTAHRNDYTITAYGDSKGDAQLLSYANNGILIKH